MLRVAALSALLLFAIQDASKQEQEYVAEFLEWLEHPNELGRKPDKVEVIDRRELVWPAGEHAGKKRLAVLIRYEAESDVKDGSQDFGVGIAGPLKWCSFWDDYLRLPPEDVYGCYATWHLKQKNRISEVDVPKESHFKAVRENWKGPALKDIRFRKVNELKGSDGAKSTFVGLAEARCGDQSGYAVFDGKFSRFYSKSIFPDDLWYGHVLPAHLGRRYLGLAESRERERWKKSPMPRGKSMEAEAAFVEETIRKAKAGREKLPNSQLHRFPDALEAAGPWFQLKGRGEEFTAILDYLEKEWRSYWLWNECLGRAAYKIGLHERAVKWLGERVETDKYPGRGDEAIFLARSMVKVGKVSEARAPLMRALKASVEESKAEGVYLVDLWGHEEWFQGFRGAYLELFGTNASKELEKAGLPETLLPPALDIPARD